MIILTQISFHSFSLLTEFINVLSERMMKIQPPFDLSHVNGVTKLCQLDSRKFLDALRNFELWALKSEFNNET